MCDTRALARALVLRCETSVCAPTHTHAHAIAPRAHQDIAPFLQKLAQRLGKSKQELCIWDPYYCAGKVKAHLRKLGFTNVVNENKDFYELQTNGFFASLRAWFHRMWNPQSLSIDFATLQQKFMS